MDNYIGEDDIELKQKVIDAYMADLTTIWKNNLDLSFAQLVLNVFDKPCCYGWNNWKSLHQIKKYYKPNEE